MRNILSRETTHCKLELKGQVVLFFVAQRILLTSRFYDLRQLWTASRPHLQVGRGKLLILLG